MLKRTVSSPIRRSTQTIRLSQSLPDFSNLRDRRRLLSGAFSGTPSGDIILARADLDGSAMGVAVETIQLLSNFGHGAEGKEALGIFLNYIQPFAGDENADFIRNLFQNYPLDAPISPQTNIEEWHGTESVDDVYEKIIGENTLIHIYMLEHALNAANAVARVEIPGKGVGSGFLISFDLLMTNHHVISSIPEMEKAEVTFNYQLGIDEKPIPPLPFRIKPDGLFYTNKELDYTIIQLEVASEIIPLPLKRLKVQKGERVAIIQHPGGHFKKISMQNNFVEYADEREVQYTNSTEPGSSGSPVFNERFEVVAIHHSGGMLLEPTTKRKYLRNGGSSVISILNDLEINCQPIYKAVVK